MLALSLVLLALIFYVYFGYFFLLGLLGIYINKRVQKKEIMPSVSLMIAAYNEEKGIEGKILNSLSLDYPKELLDIVVVSDASSDQTDAIVERYADRGVRLIRIEGRVGKTEARNQALKMVKSEIIVFSDATTEYKTDSIQKLVRNFADPSVGMVTGHLLYQDPGGAMGTGQKLYWKYESFIKECQTKLGTLTGSVGCISAFRRSAYTELPPEIIEDFTEPLMFILKGYRVVFEKDAICYEMATSRPAQEWAMRVRVVRGGLAGIIYARALLNPFRFPLASFQLISHKLLRWLVPALALILFACTSINYLNFPSNIYGELLIWGQLIFYLSVFLSFLGERIGVSLKFLKINQYLFIVNAASLAAIYKTLTEPKEATWETDRGV